MFFFGFEVLNIVSVHMQMTGLLMTKFYCFVNGQKMDSQKAIVGALHRRSNWLWLGNFSVTCGSEYVGYKHGQKNVFNSDSHVTRKNDTIFP